MGQWDGHLKETHHLGSGPAVRGQRRPFQARPPLPCLLPHQASGARTAPSTHEALVKRSLSIFFHMCIFKLVVMEVSRHTEVEMRPKGPSTAVAATSPATLVSSAISTFSLGVFQSKSQKAHRLAPALSCAGVCQSGPRAPSLPAWPESLHRPRGPSLGKRTLAPVNPRGL